jgi:hypothetical protein
MSERPWFPFHASDWLGDTDLRSCSLAARGLWADCLAMMHDARPRGHLMQRGKALDAVALALAVGRPVKEVRAALAELEEAEVSSRTEAGVIYSRRMVRDTQKGERASANGRLGGNPVLLKPESPLEVKPKVIPHARDTRLVSGLSASSGSGSSEREPERKPSALIRPAPKNAVFAGVFVVPDFLDSEFERKSGGWSYDKRMAWYHELNREWEGKPIGESDLSFLRKRFEERIGATAKAFVNPKSAQNAATLAAVLAKGAH